MRSKCSTGQRVAAIPGLAGVSVPIRLGGQMVGSLTPIRVRHVHLAGGTGETRPPAVAG